VLYVAEGRQQSSLDGFWGTLSESRKARIAAVAMDMWDPYVDSVREHLAEAEKKIVFDKFHMAKHWGEAVDQVRRQEQEVLRAAGDDRLTGTRYDWLRNPTTMAVEDRRAFPALRQSELKTARAWALKETGMTLFHYIYEGPARKHFQFQWWYNWATRSRLRPMIAVARTLKRQLENILTYLKHRITNATTKYTARGFRNQQNFVNAIYFHCGGLDLAPSPTK
jgi:transposase